MTLLETHADILSSSDNHFISPHSNYSTKKKKKEEEERSRTMLDDLHLFIIARLKSISPSAALSVVLDPRTSFHLLFFHFFLPPSIPKGSHKTPENDVCK